MVSGPGDGLPTPHVLFEHRHLSREVENETTNCSDPCLTIDPSTGASEARSRTQGDVKTPVHLWGGLS